MKKVFTIVLVLASTLGFAQRTELYALGGLNGAVIKQGNSVLQEHTRLYSPTFGFLAGLGSEYILGETGLLYSTQGTRFSQTSLTTGTKKYDIKLRYLDVP